MPAEQSVADIAIRPFEPADHDGVGNLVVGIQQGEFGMAITREQQADLQDVIAFFRRGGGNLWVAASEDKIVGTIGLVDIGNGQGALRKMFVDREYRGPEYGVARRLLGTLLQWAPAHAITDIYLGTTEKFQAAHRFYEKSGFARVDPERLPSSFPRMNVDTRFYRLRLDLKGAPVVVA